MSQDAFRRTDEIGTVGLPSSQGNNDGGGVGENDVPNDGRPARVGRPLQAKKEEDPAKEAFNFNCILRLITSL